MERKCYKQKFRLQIVCRYQQLIIQLASYTLLIQKAFKAHQDAVENATIGVSINSAKNQRQLQDSRREPPDVGGGVLPLNTSDSCRTCTVLSQLCFLTDCYF
ncbi:Hypothetical_protein [Hexamita inflata]|uniref:Hypothetical_protein n=1 Tax=Hexamita inflata TaxID=28002 RepID=A0AA86TU83_9EUKA|nr:Hypothetical protein HINF_LOCUS16365 [Hexamita inflata]